MILKDLRLFFLFLLPLFFILSLCVYSHVDCPVGDIVVKAFSFPSWDLDCWEQKNEKMLPKCSHFNILVGVNFQIYIFCSCQKKEKG